MKVRKVSSDDADPSDTSDTKPSKLQGLPMMSNQNIETNAQVCKFNHHCNTTNEYLIIVYDSKTSSFWLSDIYSA